MIRRAIAKGALLALAILALPIRGNAQNAEPELVLQRGSNEAVQAIAFDATGSLLLTTGEDGALLWDVHKSRVLRRFPSAEGAALGFHDGSAGAVVGLRRYDVASGRLTDDFDTKIKETAGFAIAKNGSIAENVASSGGESATIVWRAKNGESARAYPLAGTRGLDSALAFSPDGSRLFSDAPIVERDLSTGRILHVLDGEYERVLAYSPDARFAVTVHVEEVRTIKALSAREAVTMAKMLGVMASLGLPLWHQIDLIDLGERRIVKRWRAFTPRVVAAFSPDGRSLAMFMGLVDGLKEVQVAEPSRERVLVDFHPSDAQWGPVIPWTLAYSPDGGTLAIGDLIGTVRLLDTKRQTFRDLWRPAAGDTILLPEIALSPDKQWLFTGGKDRAVLWDLTSGQPAFTLPKECSTFAVFSPNARLLFCANPSAFEVWDVAAGKRMRSFATSEGETRFAFANRAVFSGDSSRILVELTVTTGLNQATNIKSEEHLRLFDVGSGAIGKSISANVGRGAALIRVGDRGFAWAEKDGSVRALDSKSAKSTLLGRVPASLVKEHTEVGLAPGARYAIVHDYDAKTNVAYTLRSGATTRLATDGELVGFSSDGSRALFTTGSSYGVSAEHRELAVLTLSDGRVLGRTAVSDTAKLALSDDAKIAITAGRQGFGVYDLERSRLLGTLFSEKGVSTEWLVVAPNGSFDGSPAGWNSVVWRFGGNTFDVAPAEAYFNDFYEPGLLASLIAGRAPPARTIASLDRRLPVLSVDAVSSPPYGRRVRVAVHLLDAGSGAQDLRLFRNGSLVHVWSGDVLHGAKTVVLQTEITIVAGTNAIAAYAFNKDNVRSETAATSLTGPDSLARKGIARILAVGVNAYANPQFSLRFASVDAQLFADELALQETSLARFAGVEVTRFYASGAATHDAIIGAIRKLAARSQPEDAIFIYLSGHGIARGDRFYFLPYDLGYDGPKQITNLFAFDRAITTHGVSDLELAEELGGVDAQEISIVVDACQSGEVLGETMRPGPLNAKGLAQLAYDKGAYVLAAAQGNQAALESSMYGHGLLTFALIQEALHSAAAQTQNDRDLFMRQWLSFGQRRVPELQRKLIDAAVTRGKATAVSLQRPRLFAPAQSLSNDFLVARFQR